MLITNLHTLPIYKEFESSSDAIPAPAEYASYALGVLTMCVGIDGRDEKSLNEFYRRSLLWETVMGPMFSYSGPNDEVTSITKDPEMFRKLLGFQTNATPMTAAQFYKHFRSVVEREVSLPT